MDLELGGKVVFVAGASRGIGLAVARAFLREGAKVVITGRHEQALNEAAESLKAESDSKRVLAIQGDLTNTGDIEKALAQCIGAFGGLEAVVANVGSGSSRSGWQLNSEDWEAALRVNLLGSMALASAALAHLMERGRGSLTFISSIAGREAMNAPVAYSAAKAALLSAMKNLSRLAGPNGVRVNAVAPGNILFPGGSWELKLKEKRSFFDQYIKSEVPLQRFGTPDEIAHAVAFLASERAAFITGACLVIDGGQTRSA